VRGWRCLLPKNLWAISLPPCVQGRCGFPFRLDALPRALL
jgi:hypothetical protein